MSCDIPVNQYSLNNTLIIFLYFAGATPPRKRLKSDQVIVSPSQTPSQPSHNLPDDSINNASDPPLEVLPSPKVANNADPPHVDPDASLSSPIQKPLSVSEREQMYTEIHNLRKERDEALAKVSAMEMLMQEKTLSSKSVEGNDQKCQMMTGLKWGVFLH